ncbi:hypothetical protein GJ744_003745 [Endocarpon pusillum]|uniref:Uncharacterized protein n=1 Tax=Endocarpon pusillum TaxID=364733 RepID=A0A8H7A7D0_9EURO|nr:hypothetical protein GJ744_003745 [Endocarpon pusillum]
MALTAAPPMAALCHQAKRLPASTAPIEACHPAAALPATGPSAPKPTAPRIAGVIAAAVKERAPVIWRAKRNGCALM